MTDPVGPVTRPIIVQVGRSGGPGPFARSVSPVARSVRPFRPGNRPDPSVRPVIGFGGPVSSSVSHRELGSGRPGRPVSSSDHPVQVGPVGRSVRPFRPRNRPARLTGPRRYQTSGEVSDARRYQTRGGIPRGKYQTRGGKSRGGGIRRAEVSQARRGIRRAEVSDARRYPAGEVIRRRGGIRRGGGGIRRAQRYQTRGGIPREGSDARRYPAGEVSDARRYQTRGEVSDARTGIRRAEVSRGGGIRRAEVSDARRGIRRAGG